MAFIDIFNFKKYFSKPSDAQVARYGHVNALYDQLSANTYTSPYKSYVVQFNSDVSAGTVDFSVVYNDLDPDMDFTMQGPENATYIISSPNNTLIQGKTVYSGFMCGDDGSQLYVPFFQHPDDGTIELVVGTFGTGPVPGPDFIIKSSGIISAAPTLISMFEIKVYS